MNFPETLRIMNQIAILKQTDKETYFRYETEHVLGFMQGVTVAEVFLEKSPEKRLVRVQHLSGNDWGKGTWLICSEDYFQCFADAFGNLQGEQRVYKPKRKPEVVRAMEIDEVKTYLGIALSESS